MGAARGRQRDQLHDAPRAGEQEHEHQCQRRQRQPDGAEQRPHRPQQGHAVQRRQEFNSLAPSQPGYGSGWTDDNTPYIQVGPDGSSGPNGSVLYTDATGNTFVFLRNAATPPGIEATMCEVGLPDCPSTLPKGATYALEYTKTGRTIYFAGAAGKNYPLFVEYAGELTTAHYTKGLEQPTSWTDSLNETIAYTESATQGYTKATDETSKASVSYTEKADAENVQAHRSHQRQQRKDDLHLRHRRRRRTPDQDRRTRWRQRDHLLRQRQTGRQDRDRAHHRTPHRHNDHLHLLRSR